jgi:cell division transport system permease protein
MLRSLTKMDYLLRETWLGILRGGWMNWAAISTVTVLLFLMGTSLQASWQMGHMLDQFGNQLEVSVYLDTGVDALTLKPLVEGFPEVVAAQTTSKEVAWEKLMQEMGDTELKNAMQQLGGNPLVDELRVKARSAKVLPRLAEKLKKLSGVSNVQYVAEAVQRMAQLHQGIRVVGLAVTGFLTLSAVAVITTTIRLIAIARSDELEIMRLVGATRAWIYLPFVLQGLTFGGIGAWLAWLLIQLLQKSLMPLFADQPDLLQALSGNIQSGMPEQVVLPVILIGFGSCLGVIGSLFAVRSVKN